MQIPQLELQHTWPTGHVLGPHLRPCGAGGFRHTPPQSRPPRCGSHSGLPTQRSPGLHISPAMPPQLCPTPRPWLATGGAALDDADGGALDEGTAAADAAASALAGGSVMSGASAFGARFDAHAVTSNSNIR